MKILFHNYSNSLSTEPAYLSQALNQCGVQAGFWGDPNLSAFDALDSAQPDVLISSRLTLTKDIMTYLAQTNVELVLNITGVMPNQLKMMLDSLKSSQIKVPFVFSNSFDYVKLDTGDVKCHRIYPAADIFNLQPPREPILDECIISPKFDENVENYVANLGPHHLLYLAEGKLIPPFDLVGGILNIRHLYQLYKKITVFGGADFCSSQLFFDANLRAHNTAFNVPQNEVENWNSVLKTCFVEDAGWDSENIQPVIKAQIKARHTPFHRAWTLMKHLKYKDGMQKVESVKNQLSGALKDI